MDKVKAAVGMGKKDQEGEEPVSGEQGEGTTAEPLDAGNKQVQSQETTDSTDKSATEDKKEDSNADTTEASQGDKKEKKSWLKAANPFSKSKNEDEDSKKSESDSKQPTTSADQAKKAQEEERKLPPNQLGSVSVPEGASTDFAPPGEPGEGTSPTATKNMSESQEQNQSIVNASAEGVDEGKFGQANLLQTSGRSGSGQGGGPSPGQLRGSRASIAEPTKQRVFNPHATNPGRIPTAGGVAVGSKQYEQRRASRVSGDLGQPKQSPVDKEGSPDQGTENNTMFNTNPFPQSAGIPEEGDEAGGPKDTSAAPQDTSTFPPTAAAPTDGTAATPDSPSKVEQVKEKAKENLSSPSSGASKERRGSSFEKFKTKLGMGGKKE